MLVKNLYRSFAKVTSPNYAQTDNPIQFYVFSYYGDPSLNAGAVQLKVGSGETPATLDDTALESEFSSSVLSSVSSRTYRRRTGVAMTCTHTFRNASGSSVTVREVGMFVTTTRPWTMVLREVLASPVTIPAGETRTFSATVNVLGTARVLNNFKLNLTMNNVVSRDGFTYSRESNYDGAGNSPFMNKQTSNWFPDVGFGSTPMTYEETDLADSNRFRDSSLPKLSISNAQILDPGTYRPAMLMTFDVTNGTANPMTVTETGLWWKPISGTGSDKYYLMFREVLSTPVVIAPGETVPFTLRLYIDN